MENLLLANQMVRGMDNLSTGSPENLDAVRRIVSDEQWARFEFVEGSVQDIGICRESTRAIDIVLHQAGFISVPLSVEDPIGCHNTNVSGTLNLLLAARDHGVRRFVYASSSAVYGDDERMPKIETQIGRALSPYGASKLMDELYARQFTLHYGLATVGLRYFNVFGPRQNPTGGYAAVVPQWIARRVQGEECVINGNPDITRDFCHVRNVVQANILAACSENSEAFGEAFNVAYGKQTTLAGLYEMISTRLADLGVEPLPVRLGYPRPGDIIHSGADITRARNILGFEPEIAVEEGLFETVAWYAARR